MLYVAYRYGTTPKQVGFFLAAVGICSALMQALGTKELVKVYGERRTLIGGLLAGAVGFAIYGLAPNVWWMVLGIPVVALWGTAGPAVQALMTSKVGPTQQGQLQGALASLRGVSGMIGPGLFTLTFAQFIGDWRPAGLPGAPFFLSTALLLVAALLSWQALRREAAATAAAE